MGRYSYTAAMAALIGFGAAVAGTAASAQDLFLRADVGVAASDNYDNSGLYGGGVGLNLPLGFRTDATLTYRGGFEPEDFLDSEGELPGVELTAVVPSVDSLSGFLGVYYDLPEPFPFIEPFIGGGVGATRIEPDDLLIRSEGLGAPSIALSQDASTNSSYFATAGVALDFFDRVAIDVAYRYSDLGEVEYQGVAMTPAGLGVPAQSFDASTLTDDLISHEAILSLRLSL